MRLVAPGDTVAKLADDMGLVEMGIGPAVEDWQERFALHRAWPVDLRQVEQRWCNIDKLDQRVAFEPRLEALRKRPNEWHADQPVEKAAPLQHQPLIAQELAMVR